MLHQAGCEAYHPIYTAYVLAGKSLEFDREACRFRDISTVILLQSQAKTSIGVSYSTAGSVYKSQLTKSLIL